MKKKAKKHRSADYLTEREYQHRAKEGLDRMYREVVVQWPPFRGEGRSIYGPVVDIAVGPFAIRGRYEEEYTQLLNTTKPFIERLIERHNQNIAGVGEPTSFERLEHFNENARCLLCIEIEDTGSKKHCLGNLVNASALGRIGLLVARRDAVLRTFVRQRVYLQTLAEVGKNTFKTNNALVLMADQFDECLSRGIGD
jgi:hypothetical protein